MLRIAVSFPWPVPLTNTFTDFNPKSIAAFAASLAASPAAYGVDFLLPLYPIAPALDQAMQLPFISVIVMIVLLTVEWMWAHPFTSVNLRFFFGRALVVALLFLVVAFFLVSAINFVSYYFVSTFLFAIVLRGPLRVLAFDLVRWPRVGKLWRCLWPR
ncbi:hypothetical protein MGM1_0970 [Candidatus Malacoplasma girerdii]|uniref:Uncharacterized protein n=1 Tax=Candidatus Malacoplasma girerdii TaxID=1318617 RepID=A0A097SSC4_9BACT|nr:hypothetical protein MGM1_0970 [Candidatus Malacoplasma girerdii]